MTEMDQEAIKELNRLRTENAYLREKLADARAEIHGWRVRDIMTRAGECINGWYSFRSP